MAPSKKINGLDAFDKIAKPKSAEKKSTLPVITASANILTAIDEVNKLKGDLAKVKADLAIQEEIVIDYVKVQQDSKARAGEFSKSFRIEGNTTALTYTTSDSFSTPQDEANQETVKELIGETRFDAWFETKKMIAIKESVINNQDKIELLIEAMNKAGLSIPDFFNVTKVLTTCDDLDQKQFELDDETLHAFRTLVVQKKAALKGTSK